MIIQTNIDLNSTFALIKEIKQGIKQKCYITITEANINVSEVGLRIIIQTKNYKTREPIYFQRTIPEINLIHADKKIHYNIIRKTIDQANNFFRKEQTNNELYN